MISGYDETSFSETLRQYFTPAQPISKPDHLHGRAAKLLTISRALSSPGKHVFIYGDRGVGKTSLARTAVQIHLGSGSHIPIVACETESDFPQLLETVRRQLAKISPSSNTEMYDARDPLLSQRSNLEHLSTINNINDAVEVLGQAANRSGPPLVVIVDEFDQLTRQKDRKSFADLIKQLSDQSINLRLILCGIGRSLDELIGVHLSTDRYLATVELEQIPHDARWKIVDAACDHFNVSIDRDSVIRIGQISDGFPYYVHLMGEKIFWSMMDSPTLCSSMSLDHYRHGINIAIDESQTSLRQAYELATRKHSNSEDYEEVLWAVADGILLSRQVTDIYEQSYLPIVRQRQRSPLHKEIFYQRMNRLKQNNHGSVIIGNRQGWYGFRENVVRGYVRLRAERAGIQIGVDHLRLGR